MAMVRTLLHLARPYYFRGYAPSVFNAPPYDLGSFDEIAYNRGHRGGDVKTFEAGFVSTNMKTDSGKLGTEQIKSDYKFAKQETGPTLIHVRLATKDTWIQLTTESNVHPVISVGTKSGSWRWKDADSAHRSRITIDTDLGHHSIRLLLEQFVSSEDRSVREGRFVPLDGSRDPTQEDRKSLRPLHSYVLRRSYREPQAFASAPVRSKPLRTYNPLPSERDPEGTYVPMYLANLSFSNPDRWKILKQRMERFGATAGLFDELSVWHLGKKDSEPFQVQVRKFGSKVKGPRRNLVDVGYGVSQVLPLLTDTHFVQQAPSSMFLLQQPEVHLHPSAQAALGSYFCEIADWKHQLLVETHSDHILDRVRMDVRDRVSRLHPDEVSILYFERRDLDVRIHSLQLDDEGNVLGAPDSYRRFFMAETKRSLGL